MRDKVTLPCYTQAMGKLSMTQALSTVLSRQGGQGAFLLLGTILTDKELEYVEKRLRIARMLKNGFSYTQIQEELQVSAATIAMVAEQMNTNKGFQKLVDAVEKELARFRFFS